MYIQKTEERYNLDEANRIEIKKLENRINDLQDMIVHQYDFIADVLDDIPNEVMLKLLAKHGRELMDWIVDPTDEMKLAVKFCKL